MKKLELMTFGMYLLTILVWMAAFCLDGVQRVVACATAVTFHAATFFLSRRLGESRN